MFRRDFIKAIGSALVGLSVPAMAHSVESAIKTAQGKLLQTSPIAGFQYHQGEAIWAQLSQGASLQLVREPENKYDARAVRIDFNGQKLGYIPRLDNAAVSQLLDRGEALQARITHLQVSDNPWERIELQVRWLI